MRLFIAADLDDVAREAVAGAVMRLREWMEREWRGSTRAVGWVGSRNLHLTLHFLGEVPESRLPQLETSLSPAMDLNPPRLALGGWGVFPAQGPPRVIWTGVTDGGSALARAHLVLGDRLRSIGLTPESRPFSAHLTVGRVRQRWKHPWSRSMGEAPPGPACEWTLRACTLYQSVLSPSGPAYTPLLHIPLALGS